MNKLEKKNNATIREFVDCSKDIPRSCRLELYCHYESQEYSCNLVHVTTCGYNDHDYALLVSTEYPMSRKEVLQEIEGEV
jgi:hypothetical protein